MHIIGASLNKPHTSVVYGTMCIDRPTDRVRPIHVILIRCTCPCHISKMNSFSTY